MLTLSKRIAQVTTQRSNADVWEQGYQDGRDAREYVNAFASGSESAASYEAGFLAGKLARSFANGEDQLPAMH